MDPRNLYTLFYKAGNQGVKSGFIVAKNNAEAEVLGHQFCGAEPNRRFIRVESAILISPDDAEPEPVGASSAVKQPQLQPQPAPQQKR